MSFMDCSSGSLLSIYKLRLERPIIIKHIKIRIDFPKGLLVINTKYVFNLSNIKEL